MSKEYPVVKNPLTVIAIFASTTEIGGTVILPLLSESVQFYYVWFLMIFPLALVCLFFFTLYHKHKNLYAPLDFRSDEAFHGASSKVVSDSVINNIKTDAIEQRSETGSISTTMEKPNLSNNSYKLLANLWAGQLKKFSNKPFHRFGITVNIRSDGYLPFLQAIDECKPLGLIVVSDENFAFLSDEGIRFCRDYFKDKELPSVD